jgi:hypothetical protein
MQSRVLLYRMDSTKRATVPILELRYVDHETQDANDVGWATVPTKHKKYVEEFTQQWKRKVDGTFVEGVNQWDGYEALGIGW